MNETPSVGFADSSPIRGPERLETLTLGRFPAEAGPEGQAQSAGGFSLILRFHGRLSSYYP